MYGRGIQVRFGTAKFKFLSAANYTIPQLYVVKTSKLVYNNIQLSYGPIMECY